MNLSPVQSHLFSGRRCAVARGVVLAALSIFVAPLPALAQADKREFLHPGLMHSEEDFERIRKKVDAREEPWISGWNVLIANPRANLDWKPRPQEIIKRGGGAGQNYPILYNDVHAAYQCALRWKISGDVAYADKAIEILNAWSPVLKQITGSTDGCLAAGIYGYQFANAAEIMRTYPKWAKKDFEQFREMMLAVFYPINKGFLTVHNGTVPSHYWSNWDLCNIASSMAIGVLCDRRDIYDDAITYFKFGNGNGSIRNAVYYLHDGNLGQWQESGRDQGHNSMCIALGATICEMAWKQGDDLYGYDNNRFLAGSEYVAKYNLGEEVPFQPYVWGAGHRGNVLRQDVISEHGRGQLRAGFELVYNHYVNRRGIAAPYTAAAAATIRPEGGGGNYGKNSGGFDQLGFGTLTATLDPISKPSRPSGLTARFIESNVVLNWWGTANAASYRVERSNNVSKTSSVIASNISGGFTHKDENLPQGTYSYIVKSYSDSGALLGSSEAVSVDLSPQPLLLEFQRGEQKAQSKPRLIAARLKDDATVIRDRRGIGVALDGEGDYAELPAGILNNLADFTIAAWVYIDEDQTSARVFDFGDRTDRYMYLTPRGNDGNARFGVSTVHGFNEQSIVSTQALPAKQWVHVAVSLSGTTGRMYVDGFEVGTNDRIDFAPFRIGFTRQNWIGRSQSDKDPYFKGKVLDFRVYGVPLSAPQIAKLASDGV